MAGGEKVIHKPLTEFEPFIKMMQKQHKGQTVKDNKAVISLPNVIPKVLKLGAAD